MTLTKEWLLKTITELEEERDATPGAVNEDAANALAAMKRALASLEAEPVAFRSKLKPPSSIGSEHWDYRDHRQPDAFELESCVIERLYTAPPAPVSVPDVVSWEDVPEEITEDDIALASAWAHGFNQCRAAMLQGAEPVTTANKLPEETGSSLQLRNLIRQRHAEWSQATFGDVGPVGPLKHLSKEALEAAEEPDDLSEWADMQFLLWDAQRRAGISDGEITAAMEEKLKVNMARQWPEPKDGEPRLHIKAAPQQETK